MVDDRSVRDALPFALGETDFPELGPRYEGKVRDNYSQPNHTRLLVATDRISAFDHVLGTVPFKGQVLTRLSAHWFELTKSVVPNHFIDLPDPQVLRCVECQPIMAEMVVRAHLTGTTSTSIWTAYESGARSFCGYALPDGMKKNQRLERPILTPATKAPKGEHDVSGSREDILATGHVSAADFDGAAALAMKLFEAGERECEARGLILVDTKYEFGKTNDGEIIVIDEIHTPDSSRFWTKSTYAERFAAGLDPEPLDKDFVRRYYTALGYKGDGPPPPLPDDVRVGAALRYIEAFERITGEAFVPDTEPPAARIRKNLRGAS